MHLQPFPVYKLLLANHKVCGEPASIGEVPCKCRMYIDQL